MAKGPTLGILGAGVMGRLCHDYGALSPVWGDVRLYDRRSLDGDVGAIFHVCDVLIDFSGSEGTGRFLDHLEVVPKPYVLGATGHGAINLERISKQGVLAPFLYAPNFSVMATLLAFFSQKMAKTTSHDTDIEICERHHRHKKDAPSGTALMLADIIAAQKGWDKTTYCYDRTQRKGPRPVQEIGFSIARGGAIFGEHSVSFSGMDEEVTLSHRVFNRDVFAKGALDAAHFLRGQKPGLYTMADVLGLSAL